MTTPSATQSYNSLLSYHPLPDPARRAAYDSVRERGFASDAILDEYELSDSEGRLLTINALAFAHPVHRVTAEYSGLTVYNAVNGNDDGTIVSRLAQSGAPFHLIHRDDRFSFWSSGYVSAGHSVHPRAIETGISYDQLGNVFRQYGSDLNPDRILAVKQGRDQFVNPSFRNLHASQLAFWASDVTRDLLVDRFRTTIRFLRASVQQGRRAAAPITKEIAYDIVDIAIQLLGAKILADTGVLGRELRKESIPLHRLIQTAYQRFPRYFRPALIARYSRSAEQAYLILQQVRYASFVPDMLNELYTAAYNPERRKALGRFDTPVYLTRRIWDYIPVEYLPPENRVVADMTCGWGSFLVAGYERLSRISDMEADELRSCIHGNDVDHFTARLAALALLVSTSTDSWHIDDRDALSWKWLSINQPNIIVGNPPFAGSRKEQVISKNESSIAPARRQMADKFFSRAIDRLAPGGYLAMIMPRSFTAAEASPKVREQLLRECDVLEIWDLPVKAFEDAKVRTSVVFAQKKTDPSSQWIMPTRVRTVQDSTWEQFKVEPVFTISGIAANQAFWNAQSRKSTGSQNTHIIDYHLVLPTSSWARLKAKCVDLSGYAETLLGAIKGKRSTWQNYIRPRRVKFLSAAKKVVPESFVINYNSYDLVSYPNEFIWPRMNNEDVLSGAKILLVSNQEPSWGKRVKVAIDRLGYYVSHNFWVLVPTQAAQDKGITLEVIAAVLDWYVANAWIVDHLTSVWVPERAIRTIPFPANLSREDCRDLAAAVRTLEEVAHGTPRPAAVQHEIDAILTRAYDLDAATLARLKMIYEWDRNPKATLDPDPTGDMNWAISGAVDQVDPDAETLTLWLDGFDKYQTVRVNSSMPGWMLRPQAAFRTSIARDYVRRGRIGSNASWGLFTPQPYTYLTEEELLARIAEPAHGTRE